MRAALGLAQRALGNAWPNPSVGCVLVNDGRVVGRGWTQPGGRPHAETEALRRAGEAARGAVAYVTLEPCAHHGRTPPCADALVDAGISRAVVAIADPDPRVDGTGIDRLRGAGIDVTLGVGADEARDVVAGFLSRIGSGRPLVTLKLATSLDGRIATRTGESQWITSPQSRALAHGLRARHDGILVGAGTAMADNPSLTCRLPGLADRSPVRIFLDGSDEISDSHDLVANARSIPTWMLTARKETDARCVAKAAHGVDVISVKPGKAGGIDISDGLRALAGRGLNTVLVEGGGGLAASLLQSGLVDRIVWFRAPTLIGADGLAATAELGVDRLDLAPGFTRIGVRVAGADIVETYARADERTE
jgi:diaminohydroxyphosphoribosylaminopyrimidine deaminase/5-amino-6-(5-phosphoribosylamino)uracil reductase